jgi:ABC-type proline/glycine betaine transport system ATPase subunit
MDYNNLKDYFLGKKSEDDVLLSSLFILIGSSGCGKTTFSQKMLYEVSKKTDILLYESDFETLISDSIKFISSYYNAQVQYISAIKLNR